MTGPYRATADELRAIDEARAEFRLRDLIVSVLAGRAGVSRDMIAIRILAALDRAGYEIRPKPDLIPIRTVSRRSG